MKSIRGEIPWARAAPIHAHTSRPRVCAPVRVNSEVGTRAYVHTVDGHVGTLSL